MQKQFQKGNQDNGNSSILLNASKFNKTMQGANLVAQMKQTFVNTSPPKPFNPSTQIKPNTKHEKKNKQRRGPSALMK